MAPWWPLALAACWLSLVSLSAGICAPGWNTYASVPTGPSYCYSAQKRNASWAEARQWCVTQGGELVSIVNGNENDYVVTLMAKAGINTPAWIGFNDRVMENNYQWSDNITQGQMVHYTNWRSGEPNNLVDEDCAAIDPVTKKWSDASCSTQMAFTCKKPLAAPIPPTMAPGKYNIDNTSADCGYWFKYNGYCYQYFQNPLAWEDAQNDCFRQGGYLMDVLSADELAFGKAIVYAERAILKTSFYIGLNDRLIEGTFVWADGTVTGHATVTNGTNWGRGEPNDNRHLEDCVEWQHWPSNKWNDISCTTKRPYVCKRKTSATGKWAPLQPPARTACPQGYTTYTHPINKAIYCYRAAGKIAQWRTSWWGARAACRRVGSGFDLVSIHDHYEMAAVLNLIRKAYSQFRTRVFWIGLNDVSREGGYVYSDGTPTDYINWGYRQPNNLQGKQDCTQIYSYYGQWNDDSCSSRLSYICKYVLKQPLNKQGTPTVTDKYCQPGWYQYGSYCYLVKGTPSDYVAHNTAVANCKALSATLTSIHSLPEHAFLMSIVGLSNATRRLHIGLNDIKREGEFTWLDNSPVTFTNWGKNQPDNHNRTEDCVELDHNSGYWNDISCTRVKQRGYICKKLRGVPTKPTTSQSQCQKNWYWFNNYCYMAVSSNKTFNMAEQACNLYTNAYNIRANLATIRSRYDNFFLLSLATQTMPYPKNYWIGLNDQATEGRYVWTSGLPITYSKWAGNQPDDWKHYEDCAEFRTWSAQWNDQMCNKSQPYICMMPDEKHSTPPTGPPPTKGDASKTCPAGWVKHNTYCYGMFGNINSATLMMTSPVIAPMTWVNARAQCLSMGADLVSIHTQEVEDWLTNQTVAQKTGWYSFWTGLNDRSQEGGYSWSDGTGLGYTAWATKEPNDWRGSEDCVEILLGNARTGWKYRWNDQSCASRRPFICALPAGYPFLSPTSPPSFVIPPGKQLMQCPTGWTSTDTNCYLVQHDKRLTWTNANLKCNSYSQAVGHGITPTLASIHSPSEHLALAKILSAMAPPTNNTWNGYWIGLQDRAKENNFTWVDGSSTDYTAWGQWQPDNWRGLEDCGEMLYNQGYLWNDALCANTMPFICGFSRVVASSSLQPTQPSVISQLQCVPGWTKWGSSCYKTFSYPKMDWFNAFSNCSLAMGDLVVIESKAEDLFVQSRMIQGSAYYWMGLTDLDRENYWRWVNGLRVQYSNWGPYQPNNQQGSEDCVAVHSEDDKWYDRDCNEPHAYICEVPVTNMNYTSGSGSNGHHTTMHHGGSKAGVIAGAVIGVLVGVVLIVGLVLFMRRRSGRGRISFSNSGPGVVNATDDDDDDALLGEE